jgi:hypothetical protein
VALIGIIVVESVGSTPVPVGSAEAIGAWTVEVASVNLNGRATPAGGQEVVASLAVTYHGSGEAVVPFGFYVEGDHHFRYARTACLAPRRQFDLQTVFSGVTLRGNECFEVARNDVDSLQLYVTRPGARRPAAFSLHADT